MAFREWFRPPRHVLTIFLSVALVSAGALGWLSWLLVVKGGTKLDQMAEEN